MKPYFVGDKIRFEEERCSFTVQAAGPRFLVCNRPLFGGWFYTVVDLVENIRGTEDRVFCMGANTRERCAEMQDRLETGLSAVSKRNRIPLKIKEPK
jgi:hypothetical protein